MSNMLGWALVIAVVASACGGSAARTGDDDGVATDAGSEALLCSSQLACPAPSSGSKQTICGELYDLETDAALSDGVVGTPCTTTIASGACSLAIEAYDALAFSSNPATAVPLAHGSVELDSCGRYRVTDIEVTGIGPFVALAFDDAAGRGPAGTTVTTVISTPKIAGNATDQVEAWIVKESTTTQWTASGGPPLSGGLFVPLFRAHALDTPATDPFAPQPGVTLTKAGYVIPQYYFAADAVDRTTIDTTAATTGANGAALIPNAVAAEGVIYAGAGGLADPTSCRWHPHVGMSLPNVVFVQIFRPLDVIGYQCPM